MEHGLRVKVETQVDELLDGKESVRSIYWGEVTGERVEEDTRYRFFDTEEEAAAFFLEEVEAHPEAFVPEGLVEEARSFIPRQTFRAKNTVMRICAAQQSCGYIAHEVLREHPKQVYPSYRCTHCGHTRPYSYEEDGEFEPNEGE